MKQNNEDDPNRPETEEDGVKEELLRRLVVRQMFQHRPASSQKPSPLESKDENNNTYSSTAEPPFITD
jgi:hypothetical protein